MQSKRTIPLDEVIMIRILTLSTIFDALKAVKIQIELLDSFMQIITKTFRVVSFRLDKCIFHFESCFPFPSPKYSRT